VGRHERGEVALVHNGDGHFGVELAHAPHLAVLARHEPLVGRGELDEHAALGQVEVGPEAGDRRALLSQASGNSTGSYSQRSPDRSSMAAKRRSDGWAKRTCPPARKPDGGAPDMRWVRRGHSPAARATCTRAARVLPPARPGGGVQADDVRVQLLDHARQRHDVEDALAARQQIDDLAVGAGQHRAGPGQHEVGRGQVGPQVLTQALDGPAGGLQRDPGVEQLLDHLELEHVRVGVDASRTAALGRRQRRLEQARSGPIVELPVRDPHEPAHLRPVKPPDRGVDTSAIAPPALLRFHSGFMLVHARTTPDVVTGAVIRGSFSGSCGFLWPGHHQSVHERPTRCLQASGICPR
jgi:hypothetical protein